MSGWEWFIGSRWGEYGEPGPPMPCPRSVPIPVVGGPRDGEYVRVPKGSDRVNYVSADLSYWLRSEIAEPEKSEFWMGQLRLEKYVPHTMAEAVWRLVDDTVRDVLGLT